MRPLLKRWGVRVSPDRFLREWLEHEHFVDTGLLSRIQDFRAAGIRCYLGTNQERNRAAYLRDEMGLGAALDGVFASCDLGARKPDAAFYQSVQAQLMTPADEILLWDDAPENVSAAKAAGWRAELYTTLPRFETRVQASKLLG